MATKYPHLLTEDALVWDRYLGAHPIAKTRLFYDVRVGEGRPVGDEYPDNIRKMALDLSQRRIDVLIDFDDYWLIVEITTKASLKSIGQLAVYKHLFTIGNNPQKAVKTLLVCSSIDPDLKSFADTYQMPYEVV
jgi:hypothetical protein